MRIDSSGNVGIGTTTVGQFGGVDVGLTVDSGGAYSGIAVTDGATTGSLTQGYSTTYLYNQANGSMLFGTNNTERLRIDSSGNVGIGNTAPSSYNAVADNLVIGSTGSNGLTIVAGTSNDGSIHFADGTSGADAYRGQIYYSHAGNYMVFGTNASEAMRIDSSGNLLVGTTDPDVSFSTSVGSSLQSSGQTHHSSSGTSLVLNRTASDGTIAQFRKAGTTVGSIFNDGTAVYFNSTADGGLARAGTVYYKWSSAQFYPNVDADADLGISSRRFKDLYLSGTAKVNAVTYTGTDGTSGQVLTTDGSGNATFADAGGGGAWEYISSASSSGSYTVDFTWVGSSGYSAYVIQFSGLTNKRASGASPTLSGYTIYGTTPTALTSGYTSAAASYNSTSYTSATGGVIFPDITNNNRFNGYVYILNPESTSINEKSVSIRFNNTQQSPPFYSTAAHSSNTNTITGFRFSLSGGYPGYDGIMGQFKLYGIKAS